EELHPELLLDLAGDDHLEARFLECIGDALRAIGVSAAGLADDELLAHVVADEAGLGGGSGEVNDASDDALRRHGARELAAGSEAFEPFLAVAELEAVEEPPRHAVHGGHDARFGAEQVTDICSDVCKALGLYGD